MQNNYPASFMEASGTIEYIITNDYMFRYILQKNENVLRGLVSALLHLNPNDIHSIKIKNPINLAGDVSGKDFILDLHVLMNDNTLINLEMQVINEHNWPDRSLIYLCRSFDQLYRGQKYDEILPVFHIGFVDFTFQPNNPEFYATHKLLNIKTHQLYSDKFTLSVLDLTQIEIATEEDKAFKIDYWARLFKAKTWEDLKMLTMENEFLKETAESLYTANADEIVRQQCLAREDAECRERTYERDKKRYLEEKQQFLKEISALQSENATLLAKIHELEGKL